MTRLAPSALRPERDYPPATRGLIVVWGLLASQPFGGMVWQALHYIAGLRRLGFDVWYVEDCDSWLYNPDEMEFTADPLPAVACLARHMERIGLPDRWILHAPPPHDGWFGGDATKAERLHRSADLVLNLCGSRHVSDRHPHIGHLVYLQTDPVTAQIRAALGEEWLVQEFDRHDTLFSYGVNLGKDDCPVPVAGFDWRPTRPPVCIDWWATDDSPPERASFTTIGNWWQPHNDIEWAGEVYHWNKRIEFQRFKAIGRQSPVSMELALVGMGGDDRKDMERNGWRISSAVPLWDPDAYRSFIRGSFGEFTVAKDQNVRFRSGWFSDRSACYLAAGRPVVTQDTGFTDWIPTGEGLFAFGTEDEALAALEAVAASPERHRAAAREIATQHFAAERVLEAMLSETGVGV